MNKRTSPRDAKNINFAENIDEVVQDKRVGWRANRGNIMYKFNLGIYT